MFFYKKIIRFAQRFIVGKLFVIDNIFNTNKLRLLLLINVSVTNNSKTFFYVSNYCSGEIAEFYDFFFKHCARRCG
jgi:hypothetical protein